MSKKNPYSQIYRDYLSDPLLNKSYGVSAGDPEITPEDDGSYLGDLGRGLASGAVKGVGAGLYGVGEGFREGGELVSDGLNFLGDTDMFRAVNPLEGAASATMQYGEEIAEGMSDAGKLLKQDSTPGGDVFDPSSWTAGADPTVAGYLLHASDLVGQLAPQAAAAILSRGQSVAAQLGTGAAMGAAQGGGSQAYDAGKEIDGLSNEELYDRSGLFRDLLGEGMGIDEARRQTTVAAKTGAFRGGAIPAALGGALTQYTLGPLQQKLSGGLISRVGAAGTFDAVGEGAQEVAETMGARYGVNTAIGGTESLTADTFGDFALGALGGAATGTAGAIGSEFGTAAEARAERRRQQLRDEVAAAVDQNPDDILDGEEAAEDVAAQAQESVTGEFEPAAAPAGDGTIEPTPYSPPGLDAPPTEWQQAEEALRELMQVEGELDAEVPEWRNPAELGRVLNMRPEELQGKDAKIAHWLGTRRRTQSLVAAAQKLGRADMNAEDRARKAAEYDEGQQKLQAVKQRLLQSLGLGGNAPVDANAPTRKADGSAIQRPQLMRDVYRSELESMAGDLVQGGGVSYVRDENDRITGRTASVNPEWFKNLPKDAKPSVEQAQAAVQKALSGEALSATEERFIDAALEEVTARRTEPGNLNYVKGKRDAARAMRKLANHYSNESTDADLDALSPRHSMRHYLADINGDEVALVDAMAEMIAQGQVNPDTLLEELQLNADFGGNLKAADILENLYRDYQETPDANIDPAALAATGGERQADRLGATAGAGRTAGVGETRDGRGQQEQDAEQGQALTPEQRAQRAIDGSVAAGRNLGIHSAREGDLQAKAVAYKAKRHAYGKDYDSASAREMEKHLTGAGLEQGFPTITIDGKPRFGASGGYSVDSNTIHIADRASEFSSDRSDPAAMTPERMLHHEVGHYGFMNLLSGEERLAAADAIRDDLRHDLIPGRPGHDYPRGKYDSLDEYVAEMYSNWKRGIPTDERLTPYFEKIESKLTDADRARIERGLAETEAMIAGGGDKQAEVAAGANEANTEPTDGQKEAGNYKKGRIEVHGIKIAIENPAGSIRRGVRGNGEQWQNKMVHHYGDITGTRGADGDAIDVFVNADGNPEEAPRVFIVDQYTPDGRFDEHKVLIGFQSRYEAERGYLDSYDPGWKIGPVTGMSVDTFKEWLENGDHTRAIQRKDNRDEDEGGLAPEHQNVLSKPLDPENKFSAAAQGESIQQETLGEVEGIELLTMEQSDFEQVLDEWASLFENPPKKPTIEKRAQLEQKANGWMKKREAKKLVDQWKADAKAQAQKHGNENASKTILSLFDYTGKWSQPYVDAGYNVIRMDIQNGFDVMDFSAQYFIDNFDFGDVYGILAACPCTDFASSGNRWQPEKDRDGRTEASKELVFQTLRTIEFFRPKFWVIENPIGRIESITGLPRWRTIFQPHNFGEDYTKQTVLFGKFNDDLPIANTEPTEGSKFHSKYGGSSQKTKNARSATPEGFAYAFFKANNFADKSTEQQLVEEYPEAAGAIRGALTAGVEADAVRDVLHDTYENDNTEAARTQLLKLAAEAEKQAAKPDMSLLRERVEKLRVGELRKLLKEAGMVQKGPKPDLVERIVSVREGLAVLQKYPHLEAFIEAIRAGEVDTADVQRYAQAAAKPNQQIGLMQWEMNARILFNWANAFAGIKMPKYSEATAAKKAQEAREIEARSAERDAEAEAERQRISDAFEQYRGEINQFYADASLDQRVRLLTTAVSYNSKAEPFTHTRALELAQQNDSIGGGMPRYVHQQMAEWIADGWETYRDNNKAQRDPVQRAIYDTRIEDLSDAEKDRIIEQLRAAVLEDERTGLGSNRAWQRRVPKKYIASVDLDALKWVNDNMGHQSGDQMIALVGDAFRAAGIDADAFHVSGDEYYVQGDDLPALERGLQRAQAWLGEQTIAGEGYEYTGPGFSYGIAEDLENAETRLHRAKAQREQDGHRAARGEQPRGAVKAGQRNDTRGEGRGDQEAPAAGQANPAVDDFRPRDGWRGDLIKSREYLGHLLKSDQVPEALVPFAKTRLVRSSPDYMAAVIDAVETNKTGSAEYRKQFQRLLNAPFSAYAVGWDGMVSVINPRLTKPEYRILKELVETRAGAISDATSAFIQRRDDSHNVEQRNAFIWEDVPLGQDWEAREPVRVKRDEELLTDYTEQELADREAGAQAKAQADAKAEQAAEQRAQADRERDDFTLTGSNRPADVAASRGQNDLFGAGGSRGSSGGSSAEAQPSSGAASSGSTGGSSAKKKRGADYGKSNKVFTEDAAEKARAILRAKLGQTRTGLDPEIMQAGVTLAGYHIEAGARKFVDFTKAMVEDLGAGIRPHLRQFYEMVRYQPGMDPEGMDPAATIDALETSGAIDAIIETTEEIENVPTAGGELESDRGSLPDQDGLGRGDGAGRGSDGRGADAGSESTTREGATGSDNGSVSAGGTTAGGARGNRGGRKGRPGATGGTAGDLFAGGSAHDNPGGDSPAWTDGERAEDSGQAAEQDSVDPAAGADNAVNPGDIDNIRATLPQLLPGQQGDVEFIENRFAKPDGYGAQLTNGTGTGKTFSGLGQIKRFWLQGKKNILILAPSQEVINAWIGSAPALDLEITQLKDTQDAGEADTIVVTTYANAGYNDALASRDWDLVVADESQKLSSGQEGKFTAAAGTLDALLLHPRGVYKRAEMLNPELFEEVRSLRAAADAAAVAARDNDIHTPELHRIENRLEELYPQMDAAREEAQAYIDANQGAKRPRALFLSATPWAYQFNLRWWNGYLWDWGSDEGRSRGYNDTTAEEAFFVQHFGYRMRYGKLTKPEGEVDQSLMERQFNQWLKDQGVLRGRTLDVDVDYDRKFVVAESAIGSKLDEALNWLREADDGKYREIHDEIDSAFDYHSRMYLLESLKARHAVRIAREHMKMGRKVVVFHGFNKGGGFDPFMPLRAMAKGQLGGKEAQPLAREVIKRRPDLLEMDFSNLQSPIETFREEFGDDLLMINGTVPKGVRRKAVPEFNTDGNGKDLILVQQDAGEAGISLHDTTGKHQRVLINLGLPVKPTQAIQIEGRIYRTGSVSDAMFRYLTTGTVFERMTFASKIAERASTAENLALGEQARALREAFIDSFEGADLYPASLDEGKGGKESDRRAVSEMTLFQKAKTFYFGQQKKTSKNKAKEGLDYFATPEPLGLKMVEWAKIGATEDVLEPSAGHGAIARWFPQTANRTLVEPSGELSSRAMLVTDGKVIRERFEDHHVVNKYDAIVMNPPFGLGGKTAMEHLDKAFKHLRDGGRVVALIPEGPAADKRFNAWYGERMDPENVRESRAFLTAEYGLPTKTFERAGTKVKTRVVIIDKIPPGEDARGKGRVEIARDVEEINGFFDWIENVEAPERHVPEWARARNERQTQDDGVTPAGDTTRSSAGEAAQDTGYELDEWTHKRDGYRVYGAIPTDYVARERYVELKALAKQHNGYYSMYREKASGARRGFVFKSTEDRAAFVEAASAAGEGVKVSYRLGGDTLSESDASRVGYRENQDGQPIPRNRAGGSGARAREAEQGRESEPQRNRAGTGYAREDDGARGAQDTALKNRLSDYDTRGAYHGTPWEFSQFTTEKMGTGEGAQAYGWGLYFAGSKGVAEWYRKGLSKDAPQNRKAAKKQDKLIERALEKALNKLEKQGFDWIPLDNLRQGVKVRLAAGQDPHTLLGEDADMMARQMERDSSPLPEMRDAVRQLREAAEDLGDSIYEIREKGGNLSGFLYEVLIPADEEMLSWDLPLGEQPAKVREAMADISERALVGSEFADAMQLGRTERVTGMVLYKSLERLLRKPDAEFGAWAAERIGRSIAAMPADQAASLLLKSYGIPGLRYLDGLTRNDRARGNHNYVVFDGEDTQVVHRRTGDGMSAKQVQRIVDRFVEHYKGVADLEIVVRETAEAAFGHDHVRKHNLGSVRGAYDADRSRVILIANNAGSAADVERTLRHEILAHYGLDSLLSETDKAAFIAEVSRIRHSNKALRKLSEEIDRRYARYSETVRAEELVALIAEQKPSGWERALNRVILFVQKVLRKIGLLSRDKLYSKAEIVGLIREMEGRFARGERGGPGKGTRGRFQLGAADGFGTESQGNGGAIDSDADARAATADELADAVERGGQEALRARRETIRRVRNGQRVVLFHRSPERLTRFDDSRLGGNTGTPSASMGHFLAVEDVANRKWGHELMRVAVTLKKPLILSQQEFADEFGAMSVAEAQMTREALMSAGFDGMVIEGVEHVVVFEAANAEVQRDRGLEDVNIDDWMLRIADEDSAVDAEIINEDGGNGGPRFPDGVPQDGRERRDRDLTFSLDEESVTDAFVRKIQNKFVRVNRTQDAIKAAGGSVEEDSDVVRKEELLHGRVEDLLRRFDAKHIKPLVKAMADAGVNQQDFDRFLYARHAPERNLAMAKRNKKLVAELRGVPVDEVTEASITQAEADRLALSGMSGSEARRIRTDFAGRGQTATMNRLAARVDAINAARLELIHEYGLESAETIEEWDQYEHYVPLKGVKTDGNGIKGALRRIGQGFSVRGKESKQALGRRSKAESPLLHTIAQFQETALRAEKNKVSQAFLKLVRDNPNSDLWEVVTPHTQPKRVFDQRTRETKWVADLSLAGRDDVITIKEGGKERYVIVYDQRLVEAMKNLGVEPANALTKTLGFVNRKLAAVNTQLNPEFVISNFARDLQTAVAGMVGAGKSRRVIKQVVTDMPKAMRAVYRGLRADSNDTIAQGNTPDQRDWLRYFDEYREDGAKVGFFGLEDLDVLADKMATQFKEAQGGTEAQLRRAVRSVGEWIGDANGAVENAIRLSAYVNARRSGASRSDAASLAKNLTVNFNRKGELGVMMNSLYLFANAGIQGSAQLARVVSSKRGQYLVAGMTGSAFLLTMLNYALAGEDEDERNFYDKIPDHIKERNLVLMKWWKGDGSYIAIPLPYGYNVFHVAGSQVAEMFHGKAPGKAAVTLAGAVVGSFNPMGTETSENASTFIAKLASPTILDPFVQLAVNENFAAMPIYNEGFAFGVPKPDSSMSWRNTGETAKVIAKMLNSATGGSEFRSGLIDISPDSIEHLFDFATGGAGAFTRRLGQTAGDLVRGDDIPVNQMPFVRRVAGETDKRADVSLYYERRDHLRQLQDEYESARLEGGAALREFKQDFRGEMVMFNQLKVAERRMRNLRKQRRRIEERGADTEAAKQRLEVIEERIEAELDRFNRLYGRKVG